MVDRPIIFSAPMVRALLAGRKTQTRRLAWGKPIVAFGRNWRRIEKRGYQLVPGPDETLAFPPSPWQQVQPGDRLWVRENWRVGEACQAWSPEGPCSGWIDYQAGGAGEVTAPSLDAVMRAGRVKDWDFISPAWRPCIHLPRWASRLTLTVTDVRMQRLQAISAVDADAEGWDRKGDPHMPWGTIAIHWFMGVWGQLHGDTAWEANPEVVALTFTVEQRNIDG